MYGHPSSDHQGLRPASPRGADDRRAARGEVPEPRQGLRQGGPPRLVRRRKRRTDRPRYSQDSYHRLKGRGAPTSAGNLGLHVGDPTCKYCYHRLSPSKLEVLTMRHLITGRRRPRRCIWSTSTMPGMKLSHVPQLSAPVTPVRTSQKERREHPKTGLVLEVKTPKARSQQMRAWPPNRPMARSQGPVPELDRQRWV